MGMVSSLSKPYTLVGKLLCHWCAHWRVDCFVTYVHVYVLTASLQLYRLVC